MYVPKVYEHKGQIVVFREKHSNRYFLAETKEQVYAVSLKILKEREWIFYQPKEPELEKEHNDVIFEEGSALFTAQQKAMEQNKRRLREYNDYLNHYNMMRRAIDNNDGRIAWAVLCERQDGEYESFDFELLENIGE